MGLFKRKNKEIQTAPQINLPGIKLPTLQYDEASAMKKLDKLNMDSLETAQNKTMKYQTRATQDVSLEDMATRLGIDSNQLLEWNQGADQGFKQGDIINLNLTNDQGRALMKSVDELRAENERRAAERQEYANRDDVKQYGFMRGLTGKQVMNTFRTQKDFDNEKARVKHNTAIESDIIANDQRQAIRNRRDWGPMQFDNGTSELTSKQFVGDIQDAMNTAGEYGLKFAGAVSGAMALPTLIETLGPHTFKFGKDMMVGVGSEYGTKELLDNYTSLDEGTKRNISNGVGIIFGGGLQGYTDYLTRKGLTSLGAGISTIRPFNNGLFRVGTNRASQNIANGVISAGIYSMPNTASLMYNGNYLSENYEKLGMSPLVATTAATATSLIPNGKRLSHFLSSWSGGKDNPGAVAAHLLSRGEVEKDFNSYLTWAKQHPIKAVGSATRQIAGAITSPFDVFGLNNGPYQYIYRMPVARGASSSYYTEGLFNQHSFENSKIPGAKTAGRILDRVFPYSSIRSSGNDFLGTSFGRNDPKLLNHVSEGLYGQENPSKYQQLAEYIAPFYKDRVDVGQLIDSYAAKNVDLDGALLNTSKGKVPLFINGKLNKEGLDEVIIYSGKGNGTTINPNTGMSFKQNVTPKGNPSAGGQASAIAINNSGRLNTKTVSTSPSTVNVDQRGHMDIPYITKKGYNANLALDMYATGSGGGSVNPDDPIYKQMFNRLVGFGKRYLDDSRTTQTFVISSSGGNRGTAEFNNWRLHPKSKQWLMYMGGNNSPKTQIPGFNLPSYKRRGGKIGINQIGI